ncbi:MAG: 50S ribosomal protein L6 [Verrucomicrobia bacterium]|nr:50S ribosomal protein L6 [Verrucomicrobiota bacterium]MBS0647161.1 50S ribosomal protein L6 [Verrucomicrobiota bacterium]
MSRKAKSPILLPKGVEVKITGQVLTVKGPKGTLTQELRPGIVVDVQEQQLTVSLAPTHSGEKNFLGLFWALIANMVKGVNEPFIKELEMIGVGYRAAVQGNLIDLQLGYSHPVKLPIPQGVAVKVEKNVNIQLSGVDKRVVGQFAAEIRAKRPPEPYKGKGIRYKDEYVRRKAGKAGGKK